MKDDTNEVENNLLKSFFKIKALGCGEFGKSLISNQITNNIHRYPISIIKVEGSESSLLNPVEEDLDFLILFYDLLDEKCGEHFFKLLSTISNKITIIALIKTPADIDSEGQKLNYKQLKDSVNLLVSISDDLDSINLSDYFLDETVTNLEDFSGLLFKDFLKFGSGESTSVIKDYQFLNTLIPTYDHIRVGVGEGRGEKWHIKSAYRALRFPLLKWDPLKVKMVMMLITGGEDLTLEHVEDILKKILKPLKEDITIIWEIFIEKDLDKIRTVILAFE